ncbi:MAG TPA: serine/threonine-protein kinase [Vicinamibacterales bacterium]|nr:serine/threonine-protein kinase [Vicinamibacterales bacterium]
MSLLGRGAMGEVYRADDLKLGQPVALKLLSAPSIPSQDGLRRFVLEVRLAREIAHPNVCRVYDIGEGEHWHYLSMEYVDGETLASLQRRIGTLPPEKALDVARQLCAGLAAAHDRGVLHRDLKPSNIMIDGRGRVRIMDFGLAVRLDDGSVHEIAGTPAYMAPEQFTGGRISEQTDLYALGLVLLELFGGRELAAGASTDERGHLAKNRAFAALAAGVAPQVAEIVAACLRHNPAERPGSALSVAAALPGGDPLAAALAEGRMPSPAMIAAARTKGELSSIVAWTLMAAVVSGTLLVASRGPLLTFAPSEVPKPPQVLAERSRDILAKVAHVAEVADSEFWFETATQTDRSKPFRFVYRQSPQYLIPQNLFHVVTGSDPPSDVDGMATVTLDPSGRLIGFSRISNPTQRETTSGMAWADLFREAGLAEQDFIEVGSRRGPLVPHDSLVTWTPRDYTSPLRVAAATLGGAPVYFEVTDPAAGGIVRRNVMRSGRAPAAEAILWVFVVFGFTATTVMARRNLCAGEGDLAGARKLGLFMACAGTLSALLYAHHVADAIEEMTLLLATAGWSLVWGGFSWLAYVSFEPHVRRIWPGAMISWTRLMAGRIRDPLVGRDVVAGVLAGIGIATARILRLWFAGRDGPPLLVSPALEALRPGGHFGNAITFALLDGVQFAVAGVFMFLLLRLILRKTWLAAAAFLLVCTPLLAGASSAAPDIAYGVTTILLFMIITLRLGLLTSVVMLSSERLLTRLPLTLDPGAWYVSSSLVVLLIVVAVAAYGFIVARSGGRPAARQAV